MVLQKLRGGADLMTPGLAGPPFPSAAIKGSLVAVASLEKPTVPIVVGVCEIDVAALKNARGEKGRAVRGFHWDGDELWAWGGGGHPGTAAPDHIDAWISETADQLERLRTDLGQLEVDDSDVQGDGGAAVEEAAPEDGRQKKRNEHVAGEDGGLFEEVDVEDKALSTKGCESQNLRCMTCADEFRTIRG